MSLKIVLAVSMLVALTCALPQGYGGNQGGYGYAPSYEPAYGPDNAQYYYAVQNYDPYLYKNANLKFNRYPGGAAYNLNEEGPGSLVNVNVETFRAGQKGY